MIRLPIEGKWRQLNKNDKSGSIWYSKNLNFDKEGNLKLSPRSISLFDDSETTSNIGDTDFDYPVAFGRYSEGAFRMATTDEPFNIDISNTSKSIVEDAGSDNPNLTTNSHGVWWQGAWYESTAQNIRSNTSGTWTSDLLSGGNALSSDTTRHYLAVFKNKKALCVSDGNTIKLYDTNHTLIATLTIPTDYEIIGLCYNNYKVSVITRLGGDTAGQNSECFFFIWDGATAEAETGIGMGAIIAMCVFPYQSSFGVIDSLGRIRYFNGGGFDELANFPFYVEEHRWGDLLNVLSYGDNVVVDGDLIIINVGFKLDGIGKKSEKYLVNNPSGVWCYDPEIGLYHRTSPSISRTYLHNVTQANVNTSTNIFTTSSTIPATGNPVILTDGVVGGLSFGTVYFVIKLSATTFSLAETKDLADAGVKIDITGADNNQYFWMYDLKDFGTTYSEKSGAIAIYDLSRLSYKDYIFGGQYYDTSLTSHIYLCSNVPFLENRGYGVLPKFFFNNVIGNNKKLYIKHKPLKAGDAIILKTKGREIIGLPTTAPNNATTDEIIFTGTDEGYTTTDLSEAKTAFDSGVSLEIEFIAGVGAGQMVKITDIQYSNGTYTLGFEEDVIGASGGLKSFFVVDNWERKGLVNSDNQDLDGFYGFTVDERSKGMLYQIELRGYNTTIEDILAEEDVQKPVK